MFIVVKNTPIVSVLVIAVTFLATFKHVQADTSVPFPVEANTKVMYYFDGSACTTEKNADASPLGADLTCEATPTSVTGKTTPTTDGAYQIDSNAEYLEVSSSLLTPSDTEWTIRAWIYPLSSGDDQRFVSSYDANTVTDNWSFITTSGKLRFDWNNDSNFLQSTNNLPLNTWTLVTVTGSDNLTTAVMYFNDVVEDTTTSGTMIKPEGSAPLRFGRRGGAGSPPTYNGYIDSFEMKTEAMTSTQVEAYYNEATPPEPPVATTTPTTASDNGATLYGYAMIIFLLSFWGMAFYFRK